MHPDFGNELTGGSPAFMTTHWSMIMAAGSRSNPDAEKALEDPHDSYSRGFDRRKTLEDDERAGRSQSKSGGAAIGNPRQAGHKMSACL